MNKILKFIQNNHDLKINFNVESFHAPWVKTQFGAFNLFVSGSSTVMGCKSILDIERIETILNKIYCKENEIKLL